jgi:nitroreductase
MELSKAIEVRRSVRRYKKDVFSDDIIRQCINAACHAPSAGNSQPWKFAVVKDRKRILELSKTQTYASLFLSNAPIVIVALAEEDRSRSHWVEDVSNAVMLLMLKAAELGLGTCWNAVYSQDKRKDQKREDYVRKVLGVSEEFRVLANIGLGYPDEKPEKKIIKSYEEAVI